MSAAEREHLCYADKEGNAEECIEECPGCHWEGNQDCDALLSGCDICDPDGKHYARDPFWDHVTGCQRWAGEPCACYEDAR